MKNVISIKVMPSSRKEEVIEGDPIVVRVREPPEGRRANRAVMGLLKKHFNAEVKIIAGQKSRRKVVELTNG